MPVSPAMRRTAGETVASLAAALGSAFGTGASAFVSGASGSGFAAGLFVSSARAVTTPAIALLVIEGFILLGSFMTIFNYIGFRLQGAPYNLSQWVAGLVFLVYPIGSFASAYMGRLAGRHGRGRMLTASLVIMLAGLAILVPESLATIALGLAVVTFGSGMKNVAALSVLLLFLFFRPSGLLGAAK